MTIEKINFSYPKGTLQSVFDCEAMTALELASKTSQKVDECVELVNGVEQIAIEATAVVDTMKIQQEQFLIDNADITAQVTADNQALLDSLTASNTTFQNGVNASKTQFESDMNTSLANFENSLTTSKTTFEGNMNTALADFETSLNTSKTTFEGDMNTAVQAVTANSQTTIETDVNTKIDALVADGTLESLINVEIMGDVNTSISTLNTNVGSLTTEVDNHLTVESKVFVNVIDPPAPLVACKGDGVTNDTITLQAIIDHVRDAGGGIIFIPKGRYLLNNTITLYSNITLIGAGKLTVLDFTTAPVMSLLITAQGSLGGVIYATQDFIEGASTLTLPTAGLLANDFIKVSSSTLFETSTNQVKGEIQRINNISSGSNLQIRGKLLDSYLMTATAKAQKMTMIENVVVRDLMIVGAGIESKHYGLNLDTCYNVEVQNVTFKDTDRLGVIMRDVVNAKILNCEYLNILESGFGYGVDIAYACQHIQVKGGYAENIGTGVAIGGGTEREGIPRFISVIGMHVSAFYRNGLNSHAGGDWISFLDNTIEGGYVAVGLGDGIACNCNRYLIAGNTLRNCPRHGIYTAPSASPKTDATIINNKLYKISSIGILVLADVNSSLFGTTKINGNTVNTCGAQGIYVDSTQAFSYDNVNISDNSVLNCVGIGVYVKAVKNLKLDSNDIYPLPNQTAVAIKNIVQGIVADNIIDSNGTGSGIAMTATSAGLSKDVLVVNNVCSNLSIGITFDDFCQYSRIAGNNVRTCGTKTSLGSGTGNVLGTDNMV